MSNQLIVLAAVLAGCGGFYTHAQTPPSSKMETHAVPALKQPLSLLKPPVGAKVAIIEFDDLECPYCAHAAPILEAAAAQYKIPLVHHDYPLTEIHSWSFTAAVTARYLENSVSPSVAHDFRRDVFANQSLIASKDDLARFTQRWFQAHHEALPFVMDARGDCTRQVKADRALGDAVGNAATTPCIYVVTSTSQTKLNNVDQLYAAVDAAFAEEATGRRSRMRKQ